VPGAAALARELGIDRARPLIVAGSTAEDEEALLHWVCPPGTQLLCAPRKPEHFVDAALALPGCTRRSDRKPRPSDRFLLDTIGELRQAYALADLVVIGRSFGTLFGSDPLEPAALAKPVIIGPRFGDFDAIVRTLLASEAIVQTDRASLPEMLRRLMLDRTARESLGAKALECVRANLGATDRHRAAILEHLAKLPARSAQKQSEPT